MVFPDISNIGAKSVAYGKNSRVLDIIPSWISVPVEHEDIFRFDVSTFNKAINITFYKPETYDFIYDLTLPYSRVYKLLHSPLKHNTYGQDAVTAP